MVLETHIWLGTTVLTKIINLKCPETLNVLKLRQTQVDSEGMCHVHFCETNFWTLPKQNWYNEQGATELQTVGKGRERGQNFCGWILERKADSLDEMILVIQIIYYPLSPINQVAQRIKVMGIWKYSPMNWPLIKL